jgi:predicted secreted Zn-dependent protease
MRATVRIVVLAAVLAGFAGSAAAGVKSTTEIKYYAMRGTTPAEIAASIKAQPLHYSEGRALALLSTMPKLSLEVVQQGWACKVKKVNLTYRFTITLPRADEARMSKATRGEWRRFLAFVTKHENTHKAIHLSCAAKFEAQVARLASERGCYAIEMKTVELFRQVQKACSVRQQALDHNDALRFVRMNMFKYKSRQ